MKLIALLLFLLTFNVGANEVGDWVDKGFTALSKNNNINEADMWWFKAAKAGHADSQYWMGMAYRVGRSAPATKFRSISQNHKQSFIWYKKNAEQGDWRGQNRIGFMYENGLGVLKDYKKAIMWYKKSAEQGKPEPQNRLGSMYRDGNGVTRDLKKAYAWFSLAALDGEEEFKKNRDNIEEQLSILELNKAKVQASKLYERIYGQ